MSWERVSTDPTDRDKVLRWLEDHTDVVRVSDELYDEWRQSQGVPPYRLNPQWWWEHGFIAYAVLDTASVISVLKEGETVPPDIATLLGITPGRAGVAVHPAIPNAFDSGKAMTSTSMAYFGLVRSIHGSSGWTEGDGGVQYQTWPVANDTSIVTSLWPPEIVKSFNQLPDISEVTPDAAKHLRTLVAKAPALGGLSPRDADILTACIIQQVKTGLRREGVWIDADTIHHYLGLQPMRRAESGMWRRAGTRTEDRLEIAASMHKLDHFWVETHNVPVRIQAADGKMRTKPGQFSEQAKALIIEKRRTQQTFDAKGNIREIAVAWRFRVGDWLAPTLGPSPQIALIDQRVLGYDPYRESWESIVSHYIRWLLRSDAKQGRGRPKVIVIDTIFKQCMLPSSTRNPQTTIKHFETMMARLTADAAECAAIDYTNEAKVALKTLPRKDVLRRWKELSVVITPLVATAERNQAIAAKADTHDVQAAALAQKRGRNRPRKVR